MKRDLKCTRLGTKLEANNYQTNYTIAELVVANRYLNSLVTLRSSGLVILIGTVKGGPVRVAAIHTQFKKYEKFKTSQLYQV